MKTVAILRSEFKQIEQELTVLRKSNIYSRLLEFEQNILKGKNYTRMDLGF